ncbi:acyltransferase family protein [Parasediminibacterium paludis]|uniref:Acyltransferase family protein n=1 Tax=Parasediminibacterium paludis TaxID=908966 RepID=A0ABV8Q3G5_9BACT
MTSSAPLVNNQKYRFQALTGIRCVAVCMVFIYHNRKYWYGWLHPEIMRVANECHIGVTLFFVLSGFLIAYTYQDKPMRSASSYWRYCLIRCARILPLYWLILTAYYLDKRYGNFHFSALTYTLAHGFSDLHNLDGINQAWSLTVELNFYLLAPFLFFLQQKHLVWVILALAGLYGVYWTIGSIWFSINHNPQRYFKPTQFLLMGTFPGRATDFLAGMFLAKLIREQSNWVVKIPYKTFIGVIGLLLTLYSIGLMQIDTYHHGYDQPMGMVLSKTLLPLSIALLLAGLIFESTLLQRVLSSKLLVLLGNASFAFYLIHISYINLCLKTWVLLPDRNFVLLWLIAIFLYKFIETPLYNFCRKRLQMSTPHK